MPTEVYNPTIELMTIALHVSVVEELAQACSEDPRKSVRVAVANEDDRRAAFRNAGIENVNFARPASLPQQKQYALQENGSLRRRLSTVIGEQRNELDLFLAQHDVDAPRKNGSGRYASYMKSILEGDLARMEEGRRLLMEMKEVLDGLKL